MGVWITPAFPKLIYVLEEDNITEDQILVSHKACCKMYRKENGSRLYLGEGYAPKQN